MIVVSGEENELIFADPTESNFLKKLSEKGCTAIVSPQLEALTGADIVVSPLDVPFVPALIPKHIEAGAFLIQRKSGRDLSSSVIERLAGSLTRMRDTGAKQSQCVLLFIGVMVCDADGEGKIDNQPIKGFNGSSFWIVQSAIERWIERGGVYSNLSRPGLTAEWLLAKERHIKQYQVEKVHTLYEQDLVFAVAKNDPLQELVLIRDWRKTLFTIPGIGIQKIEKLIELIDKNYSDNNISSTATLLDCIIWLTDINFQKKVPGIGVGTINKIREWFGIPDRFNIELSVSDLED